MSGATGGGAAGAMIAVALMRGRQNERQILEYFRSKKAISPDTAIIPDHREIVGASGNKNVNLKLDRMHYLKKVDKKYYLDEKGYQNYVKNNQKNRIVLIAGITIAILLFFLL